MVDVQSNSRHLMDWLMSHLHGERDGLYLAATRAFDDQGNGRVSVHGNACMNTCEHMFDMWQTSTLTRGAQNGCACVWGGLSTLYNMPTGLAGVLSSLLPGTTYHLQSSSCVMQGCVGCFALNLQLIHTSLRVTALYLCLVHSLCL